MFGQFKNIGNMMKLAGQAREKIAEYQQNLEKRRVEGEAGGGAVRVSMNGKGHVLRVEIDQTLMLGLAGDDKTMVEELIAAAVNHAHTKTQQVAQEEMQKMAGDMDIDLPDLQGLLGGGGTGNTP